jgi:hypothetical protein
MTGVARTILVAMDRHPCAGFLVQTVTTITGIGAGWAIDGVLSRCLDLTSIMRLAASAFSRIGSDGRCGDMRVAGKWQEVSSKVRASGLFTSASGWSH